MQNGQVKVKNIKMHKKITFVISATPFSKKGYTFLKFSH